MKILYRIICIQLLLYFGTQTDLQGQSPDIRTRADYHHSGAPSFKYQYYHDFWSERDVKHGRWSEWRASGKLKEEGWYKHDKQDSLFTFYHKKGSPVEISSWREGLREGITQLFAKGHLYCEQSYREGLLHGLYYEFFPNQQVKILSRYANGRLHGSWTRFNRAGKRIKSLEYVNGKKVKSKKEKQVKYPGGERKSSSPNEQKRKKRQHKNKEKQPTNPNTPNHEPNKSTTPTEG